MQKCAHKYSKKVKSGGQAGVGTSMEYSGTIDPSKVILGDV